MPLEWPEELIAVLACPKCKGELDRLDEPEGFGCRHCGLFYAVTDGIPDFLIEDAIPWDPAAGMER
ncbi:MAG: Trm112 family protein [Acidobacteria bacterium]|nr:Trm112 family protein [Acidobacteriota bacterium]